VIIFDYMTHKDVMNLSSDSMAILMFSCELAYDNLTYPSPNLPNAEPESNATPASFKALSSNSLLFNPVEDILGKL